MNPHFGFIINNPKNLIKVLLLLLLSSSLAAWGTTTIINYTYDNTYQIRKVVFGNKTTFTTVYSYDSAGNRIEKDVYKNISQLDLPPDVPNTPITFDGVRNLLSWNCSDPEGDALTYDVYLGTSNANCALIYTGPLSTIYPNFVRRRKSSPCLIHKNNINYVYGGSAG